MYNDCPYYNQLLPAAIATQVNGPCLSSPSPGDKVIFTSGSALVYGLTIVVVVVVVLGHHFAQAQSWDSIDFGDS